MKKLLLSILAIVLLMGCAANTTTIGNAPENNPYFFAYALKDAKDPITYIVVADLDEDNVYARTKDTQDYFTIPRESVEAIRQIVLNNEQLFSMDVLEESSKNITSESIFYFSNGTKQVEIHGLNMTSYQDLNNAPNAKYVLDIFEQIKAILLEAGIDESYLQLDVK